MYMVGDKVEVRARLRDGTPSERIWKVWLTKLCVRHEHYTVEDPVWEVMFSRVGHNILIRESMIEGKISSNFEGYRQ